MKKISKLKIKHNYSFYVPILQGTRIYEIKAYTKKQAIFLFEKEHGKLRVVNIKKGDL
jgi:hypothetical protein